MKTLLIAALLCRLACADTPGLPDLLATVGDPKASDIASYGAAQTARTLLPSTCGELVRQLQPYLEMPKTSLAAGLLMAECGPDASAAVDALIPGLYVAKERPGMAAEVAEALGSIGPSANKAIPDLIRLLPAQNADVAGAAARALGRIDWSPPEVVPALATAPQHSDALHSLELIAEGALLYHSVGMLPRLNEAVHHLSQQNDLTDADLGKLSKLQGLVDELSRLQPWSVRWFGVSPLIAYSIISGLILVLVAGTALVRFRPKRGLGKAQQEALLREIDAARANMRQTLQLRDGPFVREGIHLAHRLRQSTTISGDFYNVIPRSNGTLGIYLVDVEGHGLRASQEAQDVFRVLNRPGAEWGSQRPPQEELAAADRIIGEELASTQVSVTMNFTEIDPASGMIRYANAGMPAPMLFRSGQSQPQTLNAAGVFVGGGYALYAVEPKQVEVTASPGDILVLLSDGVLEARNGKGLTFGQEGVTLAVASSVDRDPEALADRILTVAAAHSGLKDPEDDETVIVVQIGSAPTRTASTVRFAITNLPGGLQADILHGPEFGKQVRETLDAISQQLPEAGRDPIWAATNEALQNAFRYGTAPGDTIRLSFTKQPDEYSVEISQAKPWADWDREFSESRRRYWEQQERKLSESGQPDQMAGGCWIILKSASSVKFSNDGTRLRMRFDPGAVQ